MVSKRILLASVALSLGLVAGGALGFAQETTEEQPANPLTEETPVAESSETAENPEGTENSLTGSEVADSSGEGSSAVAGTTDAGTVATTEGEFEPEDPKTDEAVLDKHLREVSNQIDTLKEDTFSTKSRLLLLREEVLRRSVTGARLILVHNNDMGRAFELVRVLYVVDRESKYLRSDSEKGLNDLNNEVVFDGIMAPGDHFLTVQYVFKGREWGIFKYMKDYTFKVESGYAFVLEEGTALEVSVTATEQGDFFTAYEQRPTMNFSTRSFELASSTDETDGEK